MTAGGNQRVLLAVSSLSAGGAERMASELVNYWAGRGWDVALLTLSCTRSDHYPIDSDVERIALDLLWDSRNAWESVVSNLRRNRMIRQAVRRFMPDVVVSFIEQNNVRVLSALLGTGIPVIVSERTDPRWHRVGRAWEAARRVLYPAASAVVVQTDAVAQWASRLVPVKRVWVIPNFLRPLPLPPPYNDRDLLILGIGRLGREKGFDMLIPAFASSRARRQGWQLIIVGEGPERGRLEALAVSYGLDGQMMLPGVVPDPAAWLERARIFALPSRYEGFPNALLEAMAMGCAVVAADCPSGPSEIVRRDQDGLLVPVGDVAALAAALDQLVQVPARAAELGQAAMSVRARFTAGVVLAQWDSLIDSVAGKKKR